MRKQSFLQITGRDGLLRAALFFGVAGIAPNLTCEAQTADYTERYRNLPIEVKAATPPTIPSNTVTLTDFGAKGDGVTLCSDAFAKAIDNLSQKGGGKLVVPLGVWLTGPIELKSNIELHLEFGSVIYFSPDKSLYPGKAGKSKRVRPCIGGDRLKNIAITGRGTIDGNGAQWRPVKRGKVSDTEWKIFKAMGGEERDNGNLWYPWKLASGYPDIAADAVKQEGMRQDLVRLENCENVLFQGVTFQNSPRFHVHPCYCRNVIADGITIRCPWNAQNGDGLDLSDCRQCLIINCTVDVGDDGICMKSGEDKGDKALVNGVADILIEDNTVYHAHGGFVVGSEDVTAMRNIVVRRCAFLGTDTGLRFKSAVGRGGKTQNIFISDIVMGDIVGDAVIVQCDYQNKAAGRAAETPDPSTLKNVPDFTDIHIDRLTCRGAKNAVTMRGIEGLDCVHDIDIRNATIVYTQKGDNTDPKTTRNIRLENVKLIEDKR